MRRALVCHVTTAHRADDVRIFERECRSLAESGHYEVHLIAPGRMPPGTSVIDHQIPLPPSNRLGRLAIARFRARNAVRKVPADLYHFHDPELIPVAVSLAKAGRSVVWDAHEDYFTQIEDPSSRAWIPRPLRSPVEAYFRSALADVDANSAGVVAATQTIASRYRNPLTTVVGNEARLSDFAAASPSYQSRQVLFTGMASPNHLFRATCEAVARNPELTLAVGGRNVPQSERDFAESLLESRVRFLGWLDRSSLVAEIDRSVVGLATYADIPAYETGTSTKLFEFMAAGLPVVSTPNPRNREIVEGSNSGLVMQDFSRESLENALTELVSSNSVWTEKSRSGLTYVAQSGGWKESESAMLALYAEILGR